MLLVSVQRQELERILGQSHLQTLRASWRGRRQLGFPTGRKCWGLPCSEACSTKKILMLCIQVAFWNPSFSPLTQGAYPPTSMDCPWTGPHLPPAGWRQLRGPSGPTGRSHHVAVGRQPPHEAGPSCLLRHRPALPTSIPTAARPATTEMPTQLT